MLCPGLTAIVLIAMLAWAGHSLARLFWLITSPQSSVATGLVLPVATAAPGHRRESAVDIVYLQENFRLGNGRGDATQSAVNGQSQQAVSTRLSLVLRGAIAGTTDADSSAIIASGDLQRVYFVGEELQYTAPGVMLDSVHPQYVVLNNNGRLESLWMYEPQTAAGVPATTGVTVDIDTVVSAQPSPVARNNGGVQIRVYRDNGMVQGLQIRDDSDRTVLETAGLQVGDIITAVDGVAINQGSDVTALTRELENRAQVDLALIRNNTTVTVTVSRDAFVF